MENQSNEEPIIQFNNICKNFKIAVRRKGMLGAVTNLFNRKFTLKEALKNVSFSINKGDIVGYIGPNGAGKSTTIKIMSGILVPTSGECIIDGQTPWKDRQKYVGKIGVVFGQRSQLWWDVPVIDSFELLRSIYKLEKEDYEKTLDLLTQRLNLKDVLNTPLRQLSLGQKMKCELAGALIHKPKILFLDEPTIGLDAITKLAVRDFVKEINKEWGVTIILTTHDMSDIEALTNKIILIGRGQILYNGNFSDIKNKYGFQKTIEVEFKKEYADVSLKGFEVVAHEKHYATYKNVAEEFHANIFLNKLSEKYEVVDFQVSSLNVEEILAKLYQEFKL